MTTAWEILTSDPITEGICFKCGHQLPISMLEESICRQCAKEKEIKVQGRTRKYPEEEVEPRPWDKTMSLAEVAATVISKSPKRYKSAWKIG